MNNDINFWLSGATPWKGCAGPIGTLGLSNEFWQSNAWQWAGWTMIHFAWTGTALLALVFLTRLFLRRAHPTWRYATTLLLFALLAASPLLIAGYLASTWPEPAAIVAIATPSAETPAVPLQPLPVDHSPADSHATEIVELTELSNIQPETLATPPDDSPIIELTDLPEFTEPSAEPLAAAPSPELSTSQPPPIAATTEIVPSPNVTPPSFVSSVPSVVKPTRAEQLIATLDLASQYLPWLWLIGAPLTFALLATGLVGGERLRRSAELLTTGPIVEACEALKRQLKITRRVAIAVTDRVAQPVLVGIVRPMILLPWAALHGWRPDQIEMVLVHELAHIRRWDNLVNLGQRVVESLLFYHPAVWLVSRWLRHDREECCDAVVVAHTGEPAEYADLLLSVASQLKPRRSLLAASAMAQHPLARRIRRLLQLEDDPMLVSRTSVLMGVAALVVAAVVAANYPLWAEDEKATRDNESAKISSDEPGEIQVGEIEVEKEEEEKAKTSSPFLSLEDQRVADLAYNMLNVEVEPLAEELPPEGRERGFKGGVRVVQFDPEGFRQQRNLVFNEGDILVGLHIWPVEDFASLGEVLRKEDLEQFSPLKVYVLRPRAAARSGRGVVEEDEGPKPGGFELVTGRMSFHTDAWEAEQVRIGNQEPPTPRQFSRGRGQAIERQGREQPDRSPESDQESGGKTVYYAGKSFDEWRSQLLSELSPTEQVEAIRALAAFARAGREREAAEAIFDASPKFDFTEPVNEELAQAITTAFETLNPGAIPLAIWIPLLHERLAMAPQEYRGMALALIRNVRLKEQTAPAISAWSNNKDEAIQTAALRSVIFAQLPPPTEASPEFVEVFRRALAHADFNVRRTALTKFMTFNEQSGNVLYRTHPLVDRVADEVMFNLTHEIGSEWARGVITGTDDETAKKFAQTLGTYLGESKDHTPEGRIAAIRALGVLGPRAGEALEELLLDPKQTLVTGDLATRAALGNAFRQVVTDKNRTPKRLAEFWSLLTKGLSEEEIETLKAHIERDAGELYPSQELPAFAKRALQETPFPPEEAGDTAAATPADLPVTELSESPSTDAPPTSEPGEPAAPSNKSFEELLAQLKEGSDPAERIEAIELLQTFGYSEKGWMAADAILNVAAETQLARLGASGVEGRLPNAIADALQTRYSIRGIPAKVWVPMLDDRLRNNLETYRAPAARLIPRLRYDETTLKYLGEWTQHRDRSIRFAALTCISNQAEPFRPEFTEFYRSALKHEETRGWALSALSASTTKDGTRQFQTPPVVAEFVDEVLASALVPQLSILGRRVIAGTSDEIAEHFVSKLIDHLRGNTDRTPEAIKSRIAAIRALGALGKRARRALEELEDPERAYLTHDLATRAAVANAIRLILSDDERTPERLTALWNAAIEGLSEHDVVRLEEALWVDAMELFASDHDKRTPAEVMLLNSAFPPDGKPKKQRDVPDLTERRIPGTDIVVLKGTKEAVDARMKEKLSQLRYDGRSFDEWRWQWRNELKVEERIEAIKALGAFARAGFGREAMEEILDVAAQYNLANAQPQTTEGKLAQAVQAVVVTFDNTTGVPTAVWMPVLKERLEVDVDKYRSVAVLLLRNAPIDEQTASLMEPWKQHEDQRIRLAAFERLLTHFINGDFNEAAFREALAHDDPEIVASALVHMLTPNAKELSAIGVHGFTVRPLHIVERLVKEVRASLFHPNHEVQQEARYVIAHASETVATQIAVDLAKIIEQTKNDTPEANETRIAAIRALGALGEHAYNPWRTLDPNRAIEQANIATRAAYANAAFQILRDVEKESVSPLLPIFTSLTQGLDDNQIGELEAARKRDLEQIYPEGRMPGHALELTRLSVLHSWNASGEAEALIEIGGRPNQPEAAGGTPLDRLRYKGRSFNQWRTEWQNELNVDERIEAIKALTSFGNAGYGREAAEAIVEVAANLKLVQILGSKNSESADYKLGSALQQALLSPGISPLDWAPEVIKRYDDQPEGFARLLNQLLQRAHTDPALPLGRVLEFARRRDPLLEGQEIKLPLIADPDIKTPEVEAFIRESIMHDDLGVRIRALEVLSIDPNKPYRPNENTLQAMKKFVPELVSNLMHDDPAVTRKAARAISHPDTRTAIVAKLRQVCEGSKEPPSVAGDPENIESGALAARVAALRALGRIYVDDEETRRALLELAGSQPVELARVAAVVLDIHDNGMYDGSRRDGYERMLDWLVNERAGADEENKEALRAKLIEEIGPQMDAEAAAIDPFYDVAARTSEEGDYVQPARPGFAQGFQEEPATDPFSPAEPMQGTAPPSLEKSSETPEPTTEIADSPDVAEAANGTPPDRVRYQGRSFGDWRAQWQNELDVEQRTEAIKALTAFARAGFGREAADAILEVAAQYNMAAHDGRSAESQLVQAIKSSLEHRYSSGGIPAEVWMGVLKERVGADPKTFKRLLVAMLPIASLTESTRPIVDEFSRSEDKEIRHAAFELYFYHVDSIEIEVDEELRRALAHEDPTIVMYAIKSMVRYESVGRGTPPRVIALPVVERLRAEVLETLFHREEAVRQFGRWLIASTDDTLARRFADDLRTRLAEANGDSPEATDTRIAALRALGSLGPRARGAMESLKDPKRMFDGSEIPTRAALAMALFQILGVEDSGDRDKMGALTPLWESFTEGLNEEENKRLEARVLQEASEVFPKNEVPPSTGEVLKYLKQ